MVRDLVDALVEQGVVVRHSREKYQLSTSQLPHYEGTVDMVASGAAYVRVDELENDIYVNQRNVNYALEGDRVEVVLQRQALRAGDNPEGAITKVLERSNKQYVGVAEVSRAAIFVRPDARKLPMDVFFARKDYPQVKDGDKVVATQTVPAHDGTSVVLPIKNPKLWSPSSPFLYDVVYEVKDREGKITDVVNSYVGMRKIHVEGNKVYLNNQPFYQRLVLDQGFYPDGIWTAPSDAALKRDIELSMAAGFNGARLHQKVFEERFHYWADKLGYITWGEAPSWGMNANDPEVARNFLSEWSEEIIRDRNHPSIVTWTPMNEEWWPDRVQYPRFVCDLYDMTKALDPTRPVCTVSGGVNIKSDIWSTHNYEQDPKKLKDIIYNGERWFQTPCDVQDIPRLNVGFNRAKDNNLFDFPTYDKADMPYILDEFGGIKWVKGQDTQTGNSQQSWGYGEPPHSLEEFYARLEGQVDGLMSIAENVWGYCYTQLTDVEQEQNGIYFYDRTSKFDMNRIKAIFSKRPASSKE